MLGPSAAAALTQGEVQEAESELKVTFPDEYRAYLLRCNGQGKGRVNPLRRTAAGWRWEGDSLTHYGLLGTDFPHPDSYRDHEDRLDEREPLRGDFADEGAYRAAWGKWDDEYGVLQDHKTSGAVFVQENGCGFATLLVVTGAHRGEMWCDARATCDLILPMRLGGGVPVSFAQWLDHGCVTLGVW
ncbi:SMI1/KNR4 family protein [Streptomyces sp. NPDC047017]|uniref:SMI1/KNR4 family protein n=1 Tax=Streptomyces sp. NPDC047017 TaxID=3155024 RepID=UPI0033E90AEF